MSNGSGGEECAKSSNSQSGSSSDSPNQASTFVRNDFELADLTLYGSAAALLSRSGTVRRASSAVPVKMHLDRSEEAVPTAKQEVERSIASETFRKSVDGSYRRSLESISEYKTKNSFFSPSLNPSRDGSSMDSSCSDCTDYALRSAMELNAERDNTFVSASSSYLSWIESVNSEYFGSASSATDTPDHDSKVGEWNNFWLNYNSANNRYLSSAYQSASNAEKIPEEVSDGKSTCSTQREFNEKLASEQIILSFDELAEALRCSQRITEILQNALRRSEHEMEESRNDSYYSPPFSLAAIFQRPKEKRKNEVVRERAYSCVLESQDLQKQKQLFREQAQSSSSSCINALLNTGVADILKRVMNKRRETIATEEVAPVTRSSFSEWSTAN